MAKSKQGIFDSNKRKIIGTLDIDDDINIVINNNRFKLEDLLFGYNEREITITVGDTFDSCSE